MERNNIVTVNTNLKKELQENEKKLQQRNDNILDQLKKINFERISESNRKIK
eukprot:Awhi_evm2s15145